MCVVSIYELQKQLEESPVTCVCSVFELDLVARLCARVDIMFVHVMQIREKSGCPIHYTFEEVHLSPVDVALYIHSR